MSSAEKDTGKDKSEADGPCDPLDLSEHEDNPFAQEGAAGKAADALEKELKSQGACGKNCGWITCCLLAGFMMGTGAFVYAANYSEYGLSGAGVLGPGAFIVYLLAKILREVRYKYKNGRWTKRMGSSWVHEDGGVRWSSLVPLIGNMGATIGYTIVMTFAWRFADQAGLNQGVISSLLSFASVINCVVFYCAFGEKISKLHLIGVGFMFCGIACIGAAAATQEDDEELDSEVDTGGRSALLNGVLALVVGFGGPCIISI